MALQVPNRDDWFTLKYEFPRPDWPAIAGWVRAFATEDEVGQAWQDCTRHWLGRLRDALGGDYALSESEHFHFLSTESAETQARTLPFLERARRHIVGILKDVPLPRGHGKHVVLRFSELDDYDAYVSHFYPDGEFASSGGVFLSGGYHHIAYPNVFGPAAEHPTLVHELTHNLLVYLPLPTWLNEALAIAFESDLTSSRRDPLSRDLAERHREWWTETRIQQFWRGESFHSADGQELSYSLAQILLSLIHTDLRPPPLEFRRFVLRACWGDAGAVACREHLDIELGDLASGFLGPGSWQPRPETWTSE